MPVNNGIITAPVSIEDVAKCLGVSSFDLGTLCANGHGKINKWSKKKPIVYNKPQELTDAEFKGMAVDNNKGIYYGIKASTEAGNLYDLHNTNYSYVGIPKGGDSSPYRLTDFIGYDHNAIPTINGSIPESAYYNVDKSFGVVIDYDYNHANTTGVDIKEIIDNASDATKFESYYPCILVNGYARGLFNSTTDLQTPLKYNNIWYRAFYCNMDGFPNIAAGTYKCTLFFIRELYLQGIIDLRTWVNVQSIQSARNAFAVPNAIAVNVSLTRYSIYAIMVISKAVRTLRDTGIELSYTFPDGNPTKDTTYIISLTSPNPARKDLIYKVGGNNPIVISFNWTELGFAAAPGNKINVIGSISVSGTHISSFTFENV